MNNEIKSGKDVVDEFFAEILNVKGVDQQTVAKLVELYSEGNLTDSKIQNALEELKQETLSEKTQEDGKD